MSFMCFGPNYFVKKCEDNKELCDIIYSAQNF